MGEKTEKATPKKLRDARKKGQIAKSQDFPAAFTFIVSMAVTLGMAYQFYELLGGFMLSAFKLVTYGELQEQIAGMFMQGFYVMFQASMPVLIFVVISGILVNFFMSGPVFAPEVFKFDIKKFDPIQNLKSKFKMKTFVELLKSLFKIGVASLIVFQIVYTSLPVLTKTAGMPISAGLQVFSYFLFQVIIKVGIFFVIVAVFDLVYQKHAFNKEMMMEKFEIKQEYKDSEGNPEIKGKRKQIAQEIAYSEAPGAQAANAKAVITNPEHIAIALDFDKDVDPAPYVIAMGKGFLAERIIKFAQDNKVPIVRNISLAHKLFEESKLYEYVPEDTYEVIAEILRWILSLEEGQTLNESDLTPLQ